MIPSKSNYRDLREALKSPPTNGSLVEKGDVRLSFVQPVPLPRASVVPVKPQPRETCKWYVSIDQPECGEFAPFKVTIKGKVITAVVSLCPDHKAYHDLQYAKLRAAGHA